MLTSYKLTIKNSKEYISTDDMFSLLYVEYLRAKNQTFKKYGSYYNQRGKLKHNINHCAEEYYQILLNIFLSRELYKFIEWKPYVKTINVPRLYRLVMSALNLQWYSYSFNARTEQKFKKVDHQINILWHLYERGMIFEKYRDIPKALLKFTRAFLYIEYYLEKVFDKDYKEGYMSIFSNNQKEQYYPSYYSRYRRLGLDIEEMEFDAHEFNQRNASSPTYVDYQIYTYGSTEDSTGNATLSTNQVYSSNYATTASQIVANDRYDTSNTYVTWGTAS